MRGGAAFHLQQQLGQGHILIIGYSKISRPQSGSPFGRYYRFLRLHGTQNTGDEVD